jgi:hypothetical protein
VVVSYPSNTAVERIKVDLHDVVCSNMKNQRQLIEALNNKLRTWGNCFKCCESKVIFDEIDNYMQKILFEAMMALHQYSDEKTIRDRFWYTDYLGHKYFAIPRESDVRVMHLSDIVQIKYTPVRVNFNPYVDVDYLEERTGVTAINNITAKYRPIWDRQCGKCYYCGHDLLPDQPIRLVTANPNLEPTMANKAYIHQICSKSEFVYLHTLEDLDGMSAKDIDSLMITAAAERRRKHKKKDWKYWKLQEFFKTTKKKHIILSFAEIEKISGHELLKPMRIDRERWKHRYDYKSSMADAWESEGFDLVHLDLKKEQASFERRISGRAKLHIPEVLLENDLPSQVKEEIEHYLNNIVKEKGIVKKKDYF